jgi:hypothetical protein
MQQMTEVTLIARMLEELRSLLFRKRARQPDLDDAGGGEVTHVYDLLAVALGDRRVRDAAPC